MVVNCASAEYWKSVDLRRLAERNTEVVNIVLSGATVHVKEARGAFVRYMVVNDVTTREELKGFTGNAGEWRFDASRSDANNLHFVRDGSKAPPPKKKRAAAAAVAAAADNDAKAPPKRKKKS